MIHKLRRRLVWISGLSVIAVFIVIYIGICVLCSNRLNAATDMLTDRISSNDGKFPAFNETNPPPLGFWQFITEETPFSTRFFTVRYDLNGNIASENIEFIASISRENAREYADKAMSRRNERGWINGYRYKKYTSDMGTAVVFVDGNTNRSFTNMLLLTVGLVLLFSLAAILVLIIIFSKKGVKRIAESYEKQKQFITDANHELKTPLTLIMANLDIIENDIGQNEWLDDIRAEGERMSELVKQLVMLSKMDEDNTAPNFAEFSLSDAITDTVSEFKTLSAEKEKPIIFNVQPNIKYFGDEAGIRRVLSILLDNALKYCDSGGNISVILFSKRHPVICVENTFSAVGEVELNRLFDRFYRADKSRAFIGGYGIGLSIAKAIVEKHHGEITAYRKSGNRIGFRIIIK